MQSPINIILFKFPTAYGDSVNYYWVFLKVVALLCIGLYPNVCYHKEKRHLLIMDGREALIHKFSINIVNKDPQFPSPYFIFGEKVHSYYLLLMVVFWTCSKVRILHQVYVSILLHVV